MARLLLGAGFLAVAAYFDLRTRRVRDPLWIALGTVGLIALALDILSSYYWWNQWLLLASAALLFYAVFYGKPILDEDGVHLRPMRILLLGAAAAAWVGGVFLPNPVDQMFLPLGAKVVSVPYLATAPVMIIIYQLFYQGGLLRGGADAKAMMALTLLVPLYPDASPFPLLATPASVQAVMQLFFPFSLAVLTNAAILALGVPVGYTLLNLARGDLGAAMWRGTREPIDQIPRHSWVMERVDHQGHRYTVLFPSHRHDNADHLAKLRGVGATHVWVERQVPLILLICVGFLLAFFVGNLMLGFLTAVLPHP